MNASSERKSLGRTGEDWAVEYLCRRGYEILARNFRLAYGEIDIVARDQQTVCFIEVKTRASADLGSPLEAVSPAKQRRYARLAACYLARQGLDDSAARFDVVGVTLSSAGDPQIELIQDAFEAEGV